MTQVFYCWALIKLKEYVHKTLVTYVDNSCIYIHQKLK